MKESNGNGNQIDDDFIIEGEPIVVNNNDNAIDNNNQLEIEEEPDVEINLDGNFRFDGQENEQAPREEELYFEDNTLQNQVNQTQPQVQPELDDNLYQGIMEEEGLADWEDMEMEARAIKENQRQAEERTKAILAEEQRKNKEAEERKRKEAEDKKKEKERKKEEEKKKKEEEEKKKKEEEAPQRDFVSPYERGVAEYESEQRGYKDTDIKNDLMSKQSKETSVMKHAAIEIFAESGTFRMSPGQKKLVKDLEAFDQFMREIDGRTKLTPREMEVYDKLSLKLYKSGKEYREYLEQKIEKKKEAFDEKHKNDEHRIEYQGDYLDNAKMAGTTKLLETVERMRKEAFEKEMEEKTKELTEKCQKEAENAEAVRDQMLAINDTPESRKALQHNMEESVARTLYYNNRVEQLTKKGEFKVKPDESLPKAMERLNKAIKPTPQELDEIKKGELCKTLVNKGNEKLKAGEVLTAEEIKNSQKEYIKAEGSNLAMKKWREANTKKPEVQKNNQAQMQNQLNQNQPAPTMNK